MTLNEIKEHLSRNQFKTIANRCGYKCEKPGDGDHGVDFSVNEVLPLTLPQGTRYLDTGKILQFQLKATTEQQTLQEAEVVKYDLEAKTYNDLVHRLNNNYPLTLILAVLPVDEEQWVVCTEDGINQRTKLYWYRPQLGAALTENENSKRISIPLQNRVTREFLDLQFEELFQ
jgi:hypothetical protein